MAIIILYLIPLGVVVEEVIAAVACGVVTAVVGVGAVMGCLASRIHAINPAAIAITTTDITMYRPA